MRRAKSKSNSCVESSTHRRTPHRQEKWNSQQAIPRYKLLQFRGGQLKSNIQYGYFLARNLVPKVGMPTCQLKLRLVMNTNNWCSPNIAPQKAVKWNFCLLCSGTNVRCSRILSGKNRPAEKYSVQDDRSHFIHWWNLKTPLIHKPDCYSCWEVFCAHFIHWYSCWEDFCALWPFTSHSMVGSERNCVNTWPANNCQKEFCKIRPFTTRGVDYDCY